MAEYKPSPSPDWLASVLRSQIIPSGPSLEPAGARLSAGPTPTLSDRVHDYILDRTGNRYASEKAAQAIGLLPGVGSLASAHDAGRDAASGDYLSAGLNALGIGGAGKMLLAPASLAARDIRALVGAIKSEAPVVERRAAQAAPRFKFVEDDDGHLLRGEKLYDIVDADGARKAVAYVKIDGNTARVNDIFTFGRGGPNSLGPSTMRQILRDFQAANPGIEIMSGERVTGARKASGKQNLEAIVRVIRNEK